MSGTTTGQAQQNPTLMLKGIDSGAIPEINVLNDADFKNYVPTGIYVEIDTPLARNSRDSIFGINISGFIPSYTIPNTTAVPAYSQIMKNLFPVQIFNAAMSYARVYQDQITIPIQSMIASHRFLAGNVGVGLRITSNTSQSGNFMVTQGSALVRNFYGVPDIYQGLGFLNASGKGQDFAPQSFQLVDLSLNRQLSITPLRRDPNIAEDLAFKLDIISRMQATSTQGSEFYNLFASQFTEDWLIFTPTSDFPDQNANRIRIDIFFDYSNVQPTVPMQPIIAAGAGGHLKQILKYSDALNASTGIDKNAAVNWLPT